ncbi:MAG: hypothetical protein LBC85_12325 [Fibromonadaceae bacterium]|jgi:hypothetical protein|nr:hypothetical protein [Fibromonadaceae bacterium]
MLQASKKMQLAIIAVILTFSTVFAEHSDSFIVVIPKRSSPTENFTPLERLGTWYLNAIPGLGSLLVMNDWTGAITHWVLGGGGIALMIAGSANTEEKCTAYTLMDDPNSKIERCSTNITKVGSNLIDAGLIMWLSSYLVYNIYRSVTYNKPGSIAYNKYGDFNVAILPNRHGNINTFLMYNKAF